MKDKKYGGAPSVIGAPPIIVSCYGLQVLILGNAHGTHRETAIAVS